MQREIKNKDSKAVEKIEKTGRLYLIVSISAVAALEYSTNRTVKIYSQRHELDQRMWLFRLCFQIYHSGSHIMT